MNRLIDACECGSTNFHEDNERGEITCLSCGLVIVERYTSPDIAHTERVFEDSEINIIHHNRANKIVNELGTTINFRNKNSLNPRQIMLNNKICKPNYVKQKKITENVIMKLNGANPDFVPAGVFEKDFLTIANYFRFPLFVKETGTIMINIMLKKAPQGERKSMNSVSNSMKWASALCYYLYNTFRTKIASEFSSKMLCAYTNLRRPEIYRYYTRIKRYDFNLLNSQQQINPIDELAKYEIVHKKETLLLIKILQDEGFNLFGNGRLNKTIFASLNCIVTALLDDKDNSDTVCETFKITKTTLKNNMLFFAKTLGLYCIIGQKIKTPELLKKHGIKYDEINEQVCTKLNMQGRCIKLFESNIINKFLEYQTNPKPQPRPVQPNYLYLIKFMLEIIPSLAKNFKLDEKVKIILEKIADNKIKINLLKYLYENGDSWHSVKELTKKKIFRAHLDRFKQDVPADYSYRLKNYSDVFLSKFENEITYYKLQSDLYNAIKIYQKLTGNEINTCFKDFVKVIKSV